MADQRTMAELFRAPTEGYVEAIMVPPILAEHFELKHSLINIPGTLVRLPFKMMLLSSPFSTRRSVFELANTPNENCSTVILKKLPDKAREKTDSPLTEYREDLFATNHPSGNPTSPFSSYPDLTSPEVNDDIFDPEEDIIENLLNLVKTKDLPPYHDNQLSGNPTPISEPETKSSSSSPTLISLEESELIWEEFEAYLASDSFLLGNSNPSSPLPPFHNSLSGSTTSSTPSLPIYEISDYFLEEFADELALITFPPGNDDLSF
ncbi:hypothetical protein Tco_0677612 [Tanacetum coccineum]|uniref:Reverse transcriptase domain-containing protein n=1 Tax=Tanacetum coccineum TaxID=301880 RepID=A0ABQ4XDK6_9ASTR